MSLHLLRDFVQWRDRRPGCGEIKTVDEAEKLFGEFARTE